jgi:restriction system protein
MGNRSGQVTRQRVGKLMRTLLEVLLESPEGVQASMALAEVEKRVPPTDYENGSYPSGGRRYEKIVRFATVDLVKAGWMLKDKGIWSATDVGREAFAQLTDPAEFYKRAVQLYYEWKASQPDGELADEAKPEAIAPTASQTFEEAEERAWAEIWDYLQRIDPYELQRLVAGLLEAMGYHVSWIAPPGKDGGMDVLAWTDPSAPALHASRPR